MLKMWAGIMKASQCLDRTLICYINGAPLNEFKQEADVPYLHFRKILWQQCEGFNAQRETRAGRTKRIIFASHPGER